MPKMPGLPRPETDCIPPFELMPAARVSDAARAVLLNAAYADYYVPLNVTEAQLKHMNRVYDVDLASSVVACAGSRPVGMASLARRGLRAWISGVGVLPDWRRRGIGKAMISRLVVVARQAGARRISLEVIAQNNPARDLYASLGFRLERELLIWRRPAGADPLPIPVGQLRSAFPENLLRNYAGWHDQPPCWQREAATLRNLAHQMRGYWLDRQDGTLRGAEAVPAAYCLVSESEDVTSVMDVGVRDRTAEAMHVTGRVLLQALAATYLGQALSIMNVPTDAILSRALAALGFTVTLRQYEMVLDLESL